MELFILGFRFDGRGILNEGFTKALSGHACMDHMHVGDRKRDFFIRVPIPIERFRLLAICGIQC